MAGTYQDSVGQDTCETKHACARGEFVDITELETASSCKTCPAGKYQDKLTHTDANCVEKEKCGPGKYNDDTIRTQKNTCKSCPVGEFQSEYNTLVQSCTVKTFEMESVVYTNECPPKYKLLHKDDATRNIDCQICDANEYTVSTTADTCTAKVSECAAGHYLRFHTGNTNNECKNCGTGKFKSGTNADTACIDKTSTCGAGEFLSVKDASEDNKCVDCEVGTYQDLTSHAEETCKIKTPCLTGEYSVDHGLTKDDTCHQIITECEPGKYFVDAVSDADKECKNCATGKFKSGTNADTACIDKTSTCGAGEFLSVKTAIEDNACVDCEVGTYQNQNTHSAETCISCEIGKSQPGTGKNSCVACEAGKYQDSFGESTCKYCPSGSTSNEESAICDSCTSGYGVQSSTVDGHVTCELCSDPTHAANIGINNRACEASPCGLGKKFVAPNSCAECDTGKWSDAIHYDTTCKNKRVSCDGGYEVQFLASLEEDHACDQCSLGTHYNTDGVACLPCDLCSSGKFALQECTMTTNRICLSCEELQTKFTTECTSATTCPVATPECTKTKQLHNEKCHSTC